MKFITLITLLISTSIFSSSNPEVDRLFSMSFDELVNLQIHLATKEIEPAFESPFSSYVVTSEDIQKKGITELEKIFKIVPGVIVRTKTNGNYDIQIRGFDNIPPFNDILNTENSKSLVMVNGTPVYNYFQGGTFWETLTLSIENIERVEIVKGPSSAMYGPNAVTGVINIITKKNSNEKTFYADYTNNKSRTLTLNYNSRFEKFSYSVFAGYKEMKRKDQDIFLYDDMITNKLDTLYNQFVSPDTLNKYIKKEYSYGLEKYFDDRKNSKNKNFIRFESKYEFNEKNMVGIEAAYQKSTSINILNSSTPIALNQRDNDSYFFKIYTKFLGTNISYSGSKGVTDNTKDDYLYKYDYISNNFNIEYPGRYKDLHYRFAYNFYSTIFDDSPYLKGEIGFFNGEAEHYNSGFSSQIDYKLNNKYRFIGALRYDIYNIPKDHYLSTQLAFTNKLNKKNFIRLSYSHANQGPFIFQTHINFAFNSSEGGYTSNIEFIKNRDLKLVTTNSYEMGWRSRISKRLNTDLSLFYTDMKNFAEVKTTTSVEYDSSGINYTEISRFENTKIKAFQGGITYSLDYMINRYNTILLFGTAQKTILKNQQKFEMEDNNESFYMDLIHKYTPTFFGGASYTYDYSFFKFSLTSTYKEAQSFSDAVDEMHIERTFFTDLFFLLRFNEYIEMNINVNDLSFRPEREFIYGDKIYTTYSAGLRVRF
ncbi:MAG: hypothetical protein CR982_06865 [Candidatus Cloacimonadota bacterium]|nr:MAG: hypothetical protein CR982_06865 [Candidatus Cloacimonadota bacterium]PIE77795.1 MAG: hypothetical protein CSA15_10900 [Candidatus Delongbacteria bacterium]